jgi:hypothetical protein
MTGRAIAVAVVSLLAARAAAADNIVIESYSGKRPDNAGRLLGPVFAELNAQGFQVGFDGVGRLFESRVSRSARTEAGMPGDFADEVERGHKAWINGKFEDAIAILVPLIETAHGNAAAVSQDRKLRTQVQGALLDLALAHQRNGDPPAAEAAMGELLRSFPSLAITKASHGPDAFTLAEATRKQLATRGTLVVEVADSGTSVFLDEEYATTGTLRRGDLYPGTYRVYAAKGDLEGRTYIVDVKPGEESRIKIDIGLDAVLHVDASWTGLAFATEADRDKHEGAYAAAFAKLHGATAVAVVGIHEVDGRPALVGTLYSLESGRTIRSASGAAEPPSSDTGRQLARFLAGDESAAAGLTVFDPNAAPVERRTRTTSRWGVLKYIVTGAGLVAGGIGAYLLIQDGKCQTDADPCPKVYNNTVPGWSLAGGGAALVGLGIVMFVTDSKTVEGVSIAPTQGGAMGFYRFSF